MKKKYFLGAVIISFLFLLCSTKGPDTENPVHYKSFSRLTDPKDFSFMLEKLPEDVTKICGIAKQQIVHHNLLPYFGIPSHKWEDMNRIWSSGVSIPGMRKMLAALNEAEPKNLYGQRQVEQRLIGACMLESVFLTGLLRYKNIPARIRAGYFKDTMANQEHVVNFWENVSKAKGVERELREKDPEQWKELMNAITKREQIEVNKHIEHWICEYWDKNVGRWRLLDANDTFLKASSGIDVGFHLPAEHFQFAFEAWQTMRNTKDLNPDQYQEYPQDGRSHIRSQMLLDFFCLLNHDMAGFDDQSGEEMEFIKGKTYADTSPEELEELDMLANLLSQNPTKDELITFYRNSKTLQIEEVEKDPYSFVSSK
ncbi:MAG: hypothetical protein JSV17_18255 [Candidatus Aminicenantes bacterium]|nr:MAG: hypothetical protein JSV17_18255 [Candidatus Aminicenantes bacterium]